MPTKDMFGVAKGRGPFWLHAQTKVANAVSSAATFESVKSNYQCHTNGVSGVPGLGGGSLFVIPFPGVYRIIWNGSVDTATGCYIYSSIIINGVESAMTFNFLSAANKAGATACWIGELKAGDKIAVAVGLSSGSATFNTIGPGSSLVIDQVQ
jgi:hypothetical protein